MQKFEMGVQVEDVITGFKGTVTGYVKYITGCNQYLVSPRRGIVEAKLSGWMSHV